MGRSRGVCIDGYKGEDDVMGVVEEVGLVEFGFAVGSGGWRIVWRRKGIYRWRRRMRRGRE